MEASTHRLATPEGRALYKRRAPDAGGLHASLNDDGGLRRFPPRGLHNATSEFLFAGLAHNLRLLTAISRTPPTPQPPAQPPGQQQNRYAIAPANHEPGPEPGHKAHSAARARRTQENATAP